MAGETILIVEPNPIVLQFMVKEISPQRLKPILAQTPEEAINLALTQFPQLLLLHLPLESALDLLHGLANKADCLLPTVLILEAEINQVSVEFLRLGVQDYLTLPFTGEQLRRVIGDHLDKVEAQEEEDTALSSPEQSFKAIEPLIEVGHSVHNLLDQEAVIRQVTEAAVHLTGAEEGYLLLLDPETAELRVRAEHHLGEAQAQGMNLRVKDSLADSIVQSGKPVLLNGNETQPIKVRTGYLVKSLISIPLKINERVIGVLGVSNRKSNAGFTPEHLFKLSFLAESAGVALENARLYTEMRGKFYRRVREFTTLRALVGQLGIITDFEVGAQLVLSFILKATNAEAGVLVWVEAESPDKLLYVSQGVLGEDILRQGESTQARWWNEAALRRVLESGKAQLCHCLSPHETSLYSMQVQSRLIVPIRQGRQIMGVIDLESSSPYAFTEDDLYFVESVADQVTIALKSTILQAEITAHQRQFSLLMDAVTNGVWLLDVDLNLLAQNKAAHKIMDGWLVNPVGQTLPDLLPSHNGSVSKLCQLITQAMEDRQSVLFDKGILLPVKEKEPILVGGRVFPLIEGDQVVGALCSFWKISESWNESTTRFEFADMASHLLRTPLNFIHTSIDLLMNSKLDIEARQKTLARMREQSQRLTEFTNELLKILRLEVEGTQIHPEQVCLPTLIEGLVNLLQEEKPNHKFSFIFPQSIPMVAADPTKTELILLNLLLSATRRCPGGGDIKIALQVQGAEVVVSVNDNGKPLQGKQLNRIFQQFYPVDDGHDKLPSTYHLGLYTTKRLVELQNGRIWAKSQPGYGSQFYFSLPTWE